MIEINLIPDVKRELLRAQRGRAVVISASILTSIIAAGVVVLLLIYMFAVQGFRNEYLDTQIKDKNQEFSNVEDLSKILTIQNQLKSISELNSKKVMSSRVFDMVSAVSPTGANAVSFTQINIGQATDVDVDPEADPADAASAGGQLRLEGQTSGYDTMEAFKKTIENTVFSYTQEGTESTLPLAKNISTSDISFGEDADGNKVLRFTITFDYPAELLSPLSSNVIFKFNINGNVTDSYLGIPRFSERAKDLTGEGE